jgi:hypothetical protein
LAANNNCNKSYHRKIIDSNSYFFANGSYSRKHPYYPHGGNWKLTPLPPSDVLIHLLLSETILSPLPLLTAEISSVEGVWIFSGTTYGSINGLSKSYHLLYPVNK